MIELWRAIIFELAYCYWYEACKKPTRQDYGTKFLRKGK